MLLQRSIIWIAAGYCLIAFVSIGASPAIRVGAIGGVDLVNTINGSPGPLGGGSLTLSYPVSEPGEPVQTELGIVSSAVRGLSAAPISQVSFGFSIRVVLDALRTIRPYFIHDITSRVLWLDGREGNAVTYGVKLGLGIGLPLSRNGDRRDGSELCVDAAYDFHKLTHFDEGPFAQRSVTLTASWRLPRRR